jgi:hypothetical protein
MPELGPYGSVRGARSNARPYRDQTSILACDGYDAIDPKRTSQSRISARGSVNTAGRRYAVPSIMTIIEMEGPLIGRWPTEGSLL